MEVALRDKGGLADARESWGARAFSGSTEPRTEAITGLEFLDDDRDDGRPGLGDPSSISEEDISTERNKIAHEDVADIQHRPQRFRRYSIPPQQLRKAP